MTIKYAATVVLGLIVSLACLASDDATNTLTKLELDWAKAVERNDVDAIGRFLHADFTFISPRGGISNKTNHLEDFRNGNSRFTLVALSEVEVRVYGQTAVVTSRPTINGTVKANGRIITLKSQAARWTDSLILQDGSWTCVARHQSNIPQPPTSATLLLEQLLKEKLDGKEAKLTVVELEYAPGAGTAPHHHPGPVLVYVLEGAIDSQIEGSPLVTYRRGDAFFEPAGGKHLVSRNASQVTPARFLAYFLAPKDEPLTIPEQSGQPTTALGPGASKSPQMDGHSRARVPAAARIGKTKPQGSSARLPRELAGGRAKATVDYKTFSLGNFALENNTTLPDAKLAYATQGTLSSNKDNAVLVPSHYAADHHGYDYLTGRDLALDPGRYFVIATNMFANGLSSSPSSTPPPFHGPNFPEISIRDNVKATHELVTKEFGITKLKAVVGFSMGGQQAYQWAVSYPDAVESVVVICSNARQYPFGFVRLEGAKAAITTDAAWNNGNYAQPPEKGLRALGLHWAPWLYSQEFWRREVHLTARKRTFAEQLKQSAEAFLGADANDLLSQATTWQKHDIGKSPGFNGDLHKALRSIQARVLLMPSDSDFYFPLGDMERESHYIPFVNLVPIHTVWGHPGGGGSDQVATELVNRVLKRFLEASAN
jgi:homoserine O-acetyltransferase/O-succinyltransferase